MFNLTSENTVFVVELFCNLTRCNLILNLYKPNVAHDLWAAYKEKYHITLHYGWNTIHQTLKNALVEPN